MVLLLITTILLVGSVAATNTTSDDVSTLQKVSTQQSSSGSISSTTNSQKTQNNVAEQTTTKTATTTTQSTTTTTDKTTTTSKTTPQNNVLNTTTSKTTTQQTTDVSTTTNKSLKSSTANKAATTVSVTPIRTDSGKTTKIKATVTTTNKSKVTTGDVAFKINGKTIGHATVTNGYSSLTYKIPTTWKDSTYKITVAYGENSKYQESTGSSTLSLNNVLPTKTTVTQITTNPGKKITIKATVTTNNYAKVTGGKVAFKINGKTIGHATVSNGVASLTYTVPSSWTLKSYKITAVYGQYYQYKESTGTSTLSIKSLKTSTVKATTKISITSIRADVGKATKIKATITTSDGSKVTTGKLAFKINGKTIGYATVSKGVATLTYKIPSTWKDPRYTLTAVYGENSKYKSSTGMTTLYLNNVVSTKTTVTQITTNPGKKITIKATVTTNGIKMYGGKVAFKINGKTIGHATVSKGVATLTYTVPSSWAAKSYKITAVYGQFYEYKSSTGTTTLKVVKSSSIPAGYSQYLKATKNCQVTNSKIISLAKKFNSTYQSTYSKAKAIFNYLNKITSYSGYMNTRYGAVNTLTRGYGNCVDMAHLMIAVSRASGIPARYCHATCYFRSGLVVGHVWAEVYVSGKWYKCDLTSNSNSFGKIVNWYSCSTIRRYISLPF